MKRRRDDETGAPRGEIFERKTLPVRIRQKDIVTAVAGNDVLIVVADPGSGKTTQIPQILTENDASASVVVTQPRRVAAMSVAKRVASECRCAVGEKVGYAIRFDDRSTRGVTRIRYVTEGVLLREALGVGIDGLRNRYSHVILDEVHERSTGTDLLLGIMKHMLSQSNEGLASKKGPASSRLPAFARMMRSKLHFKVVIMSATTDDTKIANFFREHTNLNVGRLQIPGGLHQIRTLNATGPVPDFVDSTVDTLLRLLKEPPGVILAFLPGQEEIESASSMFRERCARELSKEELQLISIIPLHGSMPPEKQVRAILPIPHDGQNRRKIVIATNIAESSITIPGVRYVIDCGLGKVRDFRSVNGFRGEALTLRRISRAEADQRRGRAGRTGPGFVYRLYTEEAFSAMEKYPKPEVLRTEASSMVLQIVALADRLKSAGKRGRKNGATKRKKGANFHGPPEITREEEGCQGGVSNLPLSLRTFPLLDTIPRDSLERGLEKLCFLGALDMSMELTRLGELMARLPVSPMLARSLLESVRLGCVDAMVSVAAVLSVDGPLFLQPSTKKDKAIAAQRRFVHPCGDHLTVANAIHAVMMKKGDKRGEQKQLFYRDHFLNGLAFNAAVSVRKQLLEILEHGDMVGWALENGIGEEIEREIADVGMDELVRRCLVAGFFQNVVRKWDGGEGYIPVAARDGNSGGGEDGDTVSDKNKQPVELADVHVSSSLIWGRRKKVQPEYLLYNERVFTSSRNKACLRMVVAIERRWLTQHSSYYKETHFNTQGGE